MSSIIFWNARGVANSPTKRAICRLLRRLKFDLKDWNKKVFGLLAQKVALAENKVLKLEVDLDNGIPLNPPSLLVNAKAHHHNTLTLEESHWHQKSRIKWLKEGDRNTAFLHTSTRVRRSFNRIHSLKEGPNLITNESLIKDSIMHHFMTSYTAPHTPLDVTLLEAVPRLLSPVDNTTLISIPNEEEIKKLTKLLLGKFLTPPKAKLSLVA
ncbi:hypothetical protein QJS10_CPA07g01409 [Acorus calamus]|uniref:Uncharacterized protein n=1 Tax=Acorus calamus TaxID=4465 RepID=A0AAV9EKM8_ACOCL|nr:hypothetical protein QJS10_CPA07g01409 [Acorus calamus]